MNALPTAENISRRNIVVPKSNGVCPFSGLVEESRDHVLLWCKEVWEIWLKCYSWLELSFVFSGYVQKHFCQHELT